MKAVKYICNFCGETVEVPRSRRRITVSCPCGHSSTVSNVPRSQKQRVDIQKRSKDQERRAAKRDGAKVQLASGALDFDKGDVRLEGVYLKECKHTVRKSFSIKPELVEKIESEAAFGEIPVVEIEFQGQYPKKRIYVLPEWAWEEYMELKKCQ